MGAVWQRFVFNVMSSSKAKYGLKFLWGAKTIPFDRLREGSFGKLRMSGGMGSRLHGNDGVLRLRTGSKLRANGCQSPPKRVFVSNVMSTSKAKTGNFLSKNEETNPIAMESTMFVEDGIRLRVGGLRIGFMDTGYGRVSVWGRGVWQGGVLPFGRLRAGSQLRTNGY